MKMPVNIDLYGDGDTAQRIVSVLKESLC